MPESTDDCLPPSYILIVSALADAIDAGDVELDVDGIRWRGVEFNGIRWRGIRWRGFVEN